MWRILDFLLYLVKGEELFSMGFFSLSYIMYSILQVYLEHIYTHSILGIIGITLGRPQSLI